MALLSFVPKNMIAFSQVMLYATPFFYARPLKLLFATSHGGPFSLACSYRIAFEHGFRPDHQTPFNLALHVICLFLQLSGNFALLACLDKTTNTNNNNGDDKNKNTKTSHNNNNNNNNNNTRGGRWLGKSTAGIWCTLLMFTTDDDCPWIARILSVASILAVYFWLSPRIVCPHWKIISGAQCFIVALALETITLKRKKPFGPVYFGIFAILILVWQKAIGLRWKTVQKKKNYYTAILFSILIAVSSLKEDPVKTSVAVGFFLSWILGMVSDTPWLIFLSFGFMSTMAQGVAHELSGEMATLLRFNSNDNQEQHGGHVGGGDGGEVIITDPKNDKLAYEWGHFLFFPNMLWHAVYLSLSST